MGSIIGNRNKPTEPEPHNDHLLFTMSAALGQRDTYTYAHAQRVALYATRLARRMGLPDTVSDRVAQGGMLHDLGKLGLSDHIFSSKQTALSQALRGEVYSHPLIGAALLQSIQCERTVVDMVLYHHERIDGSGYPFGLKNDQIPLNAKIVSVADCFDAITTDRPYQRRKSRDHAFAILDQMAGSVLPADLVATLIEDIQSNGMAPMTPWEDTRATIGRECP